MAFRGAVSIWIVIVISSHSRGARADAAEVEALIAKGNELRRAGTPGPALPYFQKAYELARTPRTTAQLGLGELAAGYPVEAAEHLAAALRSPNDPAIVKYRQMLTDALTMARSQIGELAIEGGPAGAEVVIDGRTIGALPSIMKVPARAIEVVVRAPGFAEHHEVVPIVGGQRHELTVRLQKVEKRAQPTPFATGPSPPSPALVAVPATVAPVVEGGGRGTSGSNLRTAGWIVGIGSLAAAGAGILLNLAANTKAADFDTSCAGSPTNGIMSASGVTVGECQDRYDSWQSYRRWSIGGYVTGASLAVTSTVLFFASRAPSPTTGAHAQLTCAPAPNGLSCRGTF